MHRRLPPLNAMRAFEAAGRHQSFSRAAEELGVSHSAISKHVRGLEHHLGVQLFRDLPRGVALSPDGTRLLATLTPAFDSMAEATDAFAARPEGSVVVNSDTAFALKLLIPNLKSFYDTYPDVNIVLSATQALADLERYEADVAIRFVETGVPDRPAHLLSNARLFPYATPDIAARIDGNPAKILDYKLLRDRSGDPWGEWFATVGLAELYETHRPRWRLRAALSHEAVLHGLGVFLGSEENVAKDVETGRLVKCVDRGMWRGSYFMLLSQQATRQKAVRVFRDWLLGVTDKFRSPRFENQPSG